MADLSSRPGHRADYDVIIVGARVAGASLAARLGARGCKVLLLDRARFPSEPAVPSSPVLYAAGMAELDALEIDATALAEVLQPISQLRLRFADAFETVIPFPSMWGRDHAYGVDRAGFDELMWRNVARFASVERRLGFAVHDVLRDASGRVVGVRGSERGGEDEAFRAGCVVGADGRFSLVARKVDAEIVEQETRCLSTAYFAAWEGMAPVQHGVSEIHLYIGGRGLDLVSYPVPGNRVLINTHERADRVDIDGDAQAYYDQTLRRVPPIHERLRDAKQVGKVLGVKRIGNGYRRASGPGWVLVGDAVHYKDPADGQGMYDALLGARLLDRALAASLEATRTWEQAMADYERDLYAATHDMYVETTTRLRRELYSEPPPIIIKTLIRWMMTDPVYQERFLQYIGRAIPVKGWNSPRVVAGAVWRGIRRDLGGRDSN
jgi:flavin-dependent dehydrogenase